MVVVFLFVIYGLVIGSFCNVLIYRLYTGEGVVKKRSHCPKCKKTIAWRDNIPVMGFIFLRGKCRNCKSKISLQYPLVELLTGVMFGFVGYFYVTGTTPLFIIAVCQAFAMAGLAVIMVYDAKHMEIPMGVMWSVIALSAVILPISDLYHTATFSGIWGSVTFLHGISAIAAFCFFFGLSYVSDETWMGYGDAFVAIAIGLLLGPMATFIALLIAFCTGAIYGVVLMALHKKTMKSEVPFGPFLILGLMVTFVVSGFIPDLTIVL